MEISTFGQTFSFIEKFRFYIFLCIIFPLMHMLNLTWIGPVLWDTQSCRTRPIYQFCIIFSILLPLSLSIDFEISTFVPLLLFFFFRFGYVLTKKENLVTYFFWQWQYFGKSSNPKANLGWICCTRLRKLSLRSEYAILKKFL